MFDNYAVLVESFRLRKWLISVIGQRISCYKIKFKELFKIVSKVTIKHVIVYYSWANFSQIIKICYEIKYIYNK